jgi:hypothetical protein
MDWTGGYKCGKSFASTFDLGLKKHQNCEIEMEGAPGLTNNNPLLLLKDDSTLKVNILHARNTLVRGRMGRA